MESRARGAVVWQFCLAKKRPLVACPKKRGACRQACGKHFDQTKKAKLLKGLGGAAKLLPPREEPAGVLPSDVLSVGILPAEGRPPLQTDVSPQVIPFATAKNEKCREVVGVFPHYHRHRRTS